MAILGNRRLGRNTDWNKLRAEFMFDITIRVGSAFVLVDEIGQSGSGSVKFVVVIVNNHWILSGIVKVS